MAITNIYRRDGNDTAPVDVLYTNIDGKCVKVWEADTTPLIYGAEWAGGALSSWTRTDDAALFSDPVPQMSNGSGGWTTGSSPFDNIMPWKGMQKYTDSEGGTLVAIPKYWYKWTRANGSMKLQISPTQQTGFYVSPAHADRGDGVGSRHYVFVGRYHCASDYTSKTGETPKCNVTRANFRTAIHNLGNTIYQNDYALFWTIRMLYLVEYADWNSQAKIGYGCAPTGSTSAVRNMGYTDSMTYHTGTDQTALNTYGGTQYRWIEGLWDNCYDWCDGIYFSGANVYCIKNPANFSDTTGGTSVGTRTTSSGNIKTWTDTSAVTGFEYALYPNDITSDSTYSTYICDNCNYYASGTVLYAGGNYSQNQALGVFSLDGYYGASSAYASIGSRLMKLPTQAEITAYKASLS